MTRYNYLIAVNQDLIGKWAASLRGHLHDGCNDGTVQQSILPENGQPGGCRVGSHNGVDPGTNESGPGRVFDDQSSTPTIAPDGSVLYGALTIYNYEQGHLFQFSPNGDFLHAFGFGWDSTPAIYSHGNSYSIVIKNNHYKVGSYCGVEAFCPSDRTGTNPASPEAYFVTQLDHNLNIEWSFQNTETNSCVSNPDNTITCISDHPHGFEWCVNAPVIDSMVSSMPTARTATCTRSTRGEPSSRGYFNNRPSGLPIRRRRLAQMERSTRRTRGSCLSSALGSSRAMVGEGLSALAFTADKL